MATNDGGMDHTSLHPGGGAEATPDAVGEGAPAQRSSGAAAAALQPALLSAGAALDPATIARLTVEHTRDLLHVDAAALFWWDAEEDILSPLACVDARVDPTAGLPIPVMRPDQDVGGQAFARRATVVVEDYARWPGAHTWWLPRTPRAAAATPLPLGAEPRGVLLCWHYSPHAFTPDDLRLLELIAAQVAPTLESMRLYATERQQRIMATALAELMRQGAAASDVDTVIAHITRYASMALGADYAAAGLTQPDGTISVRGAWGLRTQIPRGVLQPADQGVMRRVVAARRTLLIEHLGDNPAYPLDQFPLHRAEGGRTVLGTPLASREHIYGALTLGWRSDVTVTRTQRRLLETLASYAATLIDGAQSRAALVASREQLCTVVANAPLAFWVLDRTGVVVFAEGHALAALGRPPGEVVARSFVDMYPAVPGLGAGVHRALAGESVTAVQEIGGLVYEVRYVPLRDAAGALSGAMVVALDVTERARAAEALQHQALHDTLTGLPNRALFADRLQHALSAAERGGASVALLLLDLDRFNDVNASLGHQHGDQLLREVAARLAHALPAADTLARLGGDEFALILSADDQAGALAAADAVQRALDAPVAIDGVAVDVRASIGIALFPAHGRDARTLLRAADSAVRAAKQGRSGRAVYAPDQDRETPPRLALIQDLRQAIDAGGLVLHYQPKVEIATGRCHWLEALVRWPHPTRGPIPPDQFIPLAEGTDLIAPLTRWVVEEALRQHGVWRQGGLDVGMEVNLSSWNLHDPTLPDTVAALLRTYDVAPARVRFELTETSLLTEAVSTAEVLARLDALGTRVVIDDFGIGYSSLAYLKRLPADELKIDRSFVRSMRTDDMDAVIVASTIGLAHSLGLQVVAEGVEDEETLDRLAALGCDLAQGYYLCRPLPAAEVERWLRERSGES